MAVNCGVSIGVCRARVTKVDANGNVVAGAGNSYVTDAITSATIAVNKETGNTVNVRNGCGCKIASLRFPDTFNWFDITLNFSKLEPAMEALILGAPEITDGADVVGLAYLGTPDCGEDEPAVAVELWSQHIVGSGLDALHPLVHWVFPMAILSPGDTSLGEENSVRVFEGFTRTNGNWGDGPYGDGPPDSEDISDGGWWKTDVEMPDAACAAQSVTATS